VTRPQRAAVWSFSQHAPRAGGTGRAHALGTLLSTCSSATQDRLLTQTIALPSSHLRSDFKSTSNAHPLRLILARLSFSQLDKLSPRQLQWLVAAAAFVQRSILAAQRARTYLAARPLLAAALVVLLLALLLRWRGWV